MISLGSSVLDLDTWYLISSQFRFLNSLSFSVKGLLEIFSSSFPFIYPSLFPIADAHAQDSCEFYLLLLLHLLRLHMLLKALVLTVNILITIEGIFSSKRKWSNSCFVFFFFSLESFSFTCIIKHGYTTYFQFPWKTFSCHFELA